MINILILIIVELIVIEGSDENIEGNASGFNRKNIFRQNEEGEWILYSIEGLYLMVGKLSTSERGVAILQITMFLHKGAG